MCKRSWIKYALSAINIHFKVLHTKFFHIYYIFLLDTLNVIVSFLPVRKHEAERLTWFSLNQLRINAILMNKI